jgi:hypothetical protein
VNPPVILWKSRENTSLKQNVPVKKLGEEVYPRESVKIRGKGFFSKTNAAPTSHRRRIVRGSLVLPSRR